MNSSLKWIPKGLTLSLLWLGLYTGGLLFLGDFNPSTIGRSAQAQASKPENRPIETASTPASLALAEHLQRIGAKMYGAYWCPHCHDQKERFGQEAVDRILLAESEPVYIECSPEGRTAPQAQICQQANISAYPTWIVDGQKYEGNLSLEELAQLSGYQGSQNF
ncbi:MAG: hypothetical protein J7545_05280 [Roseofilum sp. SBFL]|uniref:hypothetical protein n=1 Tax=unclassified Roseofilum TaxID=2620099 RepID=UPI001B2DF337|nr:MULTISPECIES: hypothetical protein [unclassified Roseofilum]MBP0014988.1 hypothetical protein [Roseofilum sp. SID3]MBP0024572.1 hypothetical protein [Roseofilum sp. SID2]MBP0037272.1 hypothetical protein [Roseofilum sp. SID1]MBP0041375.1 hypothetical protein [Roseofilum sp. SBFL]